MDVSKDELIEKIRNSGLRPTSQRIAILENLLSRRDHPSAESVYHSLKDKHPLLSLNTIYANLMSFAEKGLILKINALLDSARFDGDVSPHHHFVCVRCKRVIDMHNVEIQKIEPPWELGIATIFSQHLRLNGICENCSTG
jgi:Fur family peroxide stress response transcriptional regulator